MNIYIGNFSYDVTEDDLREIFGAFGRFESVKIIKDKMTGDSKGFGFVHMSNNAEAQAAIRGITEIKGKKITINEAKPLSNGGSFGNKKRDYGQKPFRSAKRF